MKTYPPPLPRPKLLLHNTHTHKPEEGHTCHETLFLPRFLSLDASTERSYPPRKTSTTTRISRQGANAAGGRCMEEEVLCNCLVYQNKMDRPPPPPLAEHLSLSLSELMDAKQQPTERSLVRSSTTTTTLCLY